MDVLERAEFEVKTFGHTSKESGLNMMLEITRLRQLLSEAQKCEKEARAKALEEAAAYHDAKVASFLKTAETAIVPSTIERAKLAAVFHETSASSIRALQSEER